jgi:hypothetical protein
MRSYSNAILRLTRNEAAVAAILLAVVCSAVALARVPGSHALRSAPDVAADAAGANEGDAPIRARCPECGVVETTRVIEQPGNREVVVHMRDGSNRVFQPETTSRWRARERLILIEGTKQASQ